MTLQEAIPVLKQIAQRYCGATEFTKDGTLKSLSHQEQAVLMAVEVCEAVENWRGKLPSKHLITASPGFVTSEDCTCNGCCDNQHCCFMSENALIDDCTSAYVANMPTQEDVLKILLDLSEGESAVIAKKIHDLLVGKVRKGK